jgi:hypothetical protein
MCFNRQQWRRQDVLEVGIVSFRVSEISKLISFDHDDLLEHGDVLPNEIGTQRVGVPLE